MISLKIFALKPKSKAPLIPFFHSLFYLIYLYISSTILFSTLCRSHSPSPRPPYFLFQSLFYLFYLFYPCISSTILFSTLSAAHILHTPPFFPPSTIIPAEIYPRQDPKVFHPPGVRHIRPNNPRAGPLEPHEKRCSGTQSCTTALAVETSAAETVFGEETDG